MRTDVAIVGGGPGGTASALFLARQGVSSVIIERDPFPRFHIGESMTGECGGVIRRLGFEQEMLKRRYPVKRGVTVYGTGGKNSFWVPVARRLETGELEEFTTWQVRRSDFDLMLLDAAVASGASVVRGEALEPLLSDGGQVEGVRVRTEAGSIEDIQAGVTIDASGRKTWLANAGVTGPKYRDKYDKQLAIFTHLRGARRDPDEASDNTLIFYQKVLHWAWFIPIDTETVSVGVVTPSDYFASTGESKESFLMRELRELNPELASRVAHAVRVEPVRAAANYSYFVNEFTGPGFLCVGDSHRFIDPIFSFGLYVTIVEAEMAANAIVAQRTVSGDPTSNPYLDYQRRATQGLAVLQDLIDGFWNNPLGFGYMLHHTELRDEIIDIFAGRIYEEGMSRARQTLRSINEAAAARGGPDHRDVLAIG